MMEIRTDQLEKLNESRKRQLLRRLERRFLEHHPEAASEVEAILRDTVTLAEAVRLHGEDALVSLMRWSLVPNEVWQHEPWGPIIQRTLVNDARTGAERMARIREELAPRLARDFPETREALVRSGVLPSEGGSGDELPAPAAEEVATEGAKSPPTG